MTGAPKPAHDGGDRGGRVDAARALPGAFGWIAADGRTDLGVVIRSLTTAGDGRYELGTGGGITVRSTVRDEHEESRWKAERLLRVGPSRRLWRASSGTGRRKKEATPMSEPEVAGPRSGTPAGWSSSSTWSRSWGIGMLAHLLVSDTSAGGIGVYVIAYTAIWMIWACFTLYSNVAGQGGARRPDPRRDVRARRDDRGRARDPRRARAGVRDRVRRRPVPRRPALAAGHRGHGPADRADRRRDRAVGRVVLVRGHGPVRAVGARTDHRPVVPGAHQQGPAGRQHPGTPRPRPLLRRGRNRGRAEQVPATIETVDADVPHLGERLGLFVLIVLGEGLVQIIDAASEAEWNRPLAVTGAGAFALMFGLWAVAVRFGYAGVALLPDRGLSPRLSWPAHLLATLGLATVAAVLGGLVAAPHEDVGTGRGGSSWSRTAATRCSRPGSTPHTGGCRWRRASPYPWWLRRPSPPSLAAWTPRRWWVLVAGVVVALSAHDRLARSSAPA